MTATINNVLGICTLSLGTWKHHTLESRLRAAAQAGFKTIDLFDEDWGHYLAECGHNVPESDIWEPTPECLGIARRLGNLVKELGMTIACTQPLRDIEGHLDPEARAKAFDKVAKRFPFMRAFDTDLTFMCANTIRDPMVTTNLEIVSFELGR
jgi:sugar phosphate isomerase/epimerase